jgi:hypothetical protein
MTAQETFILAIFLRRYVRIDYFSMLEGKRTSALVAPLDYGHYENAYDPSDHFYCWEDKQLLILRATQIYNVELLEDEFDTELFGDSTIYKWILYRNWNSDRNK